MENLLQNQNYTKKHSTKYFHQRHSNLRRWNQQNLNLQFNITSSEDSIPDLQLSPTLRQFGLSIEESNWNTASKPDI